MTNIVRSERDQWLAERKSAVGASEVAAILGEDPRRGALSIYANKVVDRPSEEDLDWMAFGRDVEGAIANGYARKSGRIVINVSPYEFLRCKDLPILGATLDRRLEPGGSEKFPAPAEGEGDLEAKAVGFQKQKDWESDPPTMFVIQVQAQLECSGLKWGSLGALFGGIMIADPVDILPSPDFVAIMKEEVEKFWWHVTNRIPPEADAKPDTAAAIKTIWARDTGRTIALDHEAVALMDDFESRREAKSLSEEKYKEVVNKIGVLMQDAAVALLPDGSSLVYKTSDVKAQLCTGCATEVKKAHTRRTPYRWWPKGLKRRK